MTKNSLKFVFLISITMLAIISCDEAFDTLQKDYNRLLHNFELRSKEVTEQRVKDGKIDKASRMLGSEISKNTGFLRDLANGVTLLQCIDFKPLECGRYDDSWESRDCVNEISGYCPQFMCTPSSFSGTRFCLAPQIIDY